MKKIKRNQAGNGGATTDQNATGATPVDNSKTNAGATTGTGQQPATQAQDQQSGNKRKKLQPGADQATGSTSQAPAVQGNGRKAKGQQQPPDANANAPAMGNNGNGKGKKQMTCDPNTDANCAPAQ